MSANILSRGDVRVQKAGKCRIVVIAVPRAEGKDRTRLSRPRPVHGHLPPQRGGRLPLHPRRGGRDAESAPGKRGGTSGTTHMTTLYFVRHGESRANVEKIFTGQTDVPLSDRGMRQAEELKERLLALHPDAFFSSDLLRAVQTVTPAARGAGACRPPREGPPRDRRRAVGREAHRRDRPRLSRRTTPAGRRTSGWRAVRAGNRSKKCRHAGLPPSCASPKKTTGKPSSLRRTPR